MALCKILLLCFALPLAFTDLKFTNGNCSYSWKKYNGSIPKDAIPGGSNSKGETFYIGLVHLKLINEVFSGMIIPNLGLTRITSLGMTKDVKNDPFTTINILCSPDNKAFEWVHTDVENLRLLLTKRNLVRGGKVLGQDLFIGRVGHNGGTLLGKVFPHKFIYQGLYVPSGRIVTHFQTFKVLTFNCEHKERRRGEETVLKVKVDNASDWLDSYDY